MKINSVAFGSAYKIPLDKSNYYALSKKLDKCEVFSKDISASSSISRGNNAFYRNIIISDEFDKEFETFLKNKGIKFQKPVTSNLPSEAEIKKRMRVPIYYTERYLPSLVEIDTEKFDKVFAKDTFSQYLSSVENMSLRHRYTNFLEYLKTGKPINASEVYIQEINGEPEILFQDGRHRYAVLRDMGFKSIPVAMNDESYALGVKYGLIK